MEALEGEADRHLRSGPQGSCHCQNQAFCYLSQNSCILPWAACHCTGNALRKKKAHSWAW